MPLTDEQLGIIAAYPLSDVFGHLQDSLHDLEESDFTQKNVADILSALVSSPVAFNLPAPDGSGNIAVKLLNVLHNVRSGAVDVDQLRFVVRHVVDKSPDDAIWDAVITFLDLPDPSTPPLASLPRTFKSTPVKASSGHLDDSEAREVFEGELFREIRNCTFRNVKGFYDKFFGSEGWRQEQEAMLRGVMTAYEGDRWAGFPASPDEKPVWDWFRSLESRFLVGAPYRLHSTGNAGRSKEREGQMGIFFQQPGKEESSSGTYKDVLVVGGLKKSHDTGRFKADFLQLTRYVRSVFADQPTRRFAHAFSLCATTMELWVFDRSGAYSSGSFNIHDEPDKFARAFVAYATMDPDAIGLDTFIKRENGYRYITVDDVGGGEARINLNKAMVRQNTIVCRGTTCYETEGGLVAEPSWALNKQCMSEEEAGPLELAVERGIRGVAKFSWASDKRKSEVETLKLAGGRGVRGVARVIAHRQITSIADMRKGLEFPEAHRFRGEAPFELISDTSQGTVEGKRKSSYQYTSEHNSNETSDSKRRRLGDQKSKMQGLSRRLSRSSPGSRPSLYEPGEDVWENRIYSCLVISPAGRVISNFRTIRELLEPIRDAIKAHRSLYVDGKILHRDISSNNIIITKPEEADGFKGMLIDLDLAKVRDSGPSGARHQTGTIQFMAIDVLHNVDHTYRHDLESFFYVLIWMCARQAWRNLSLGQGVPPPDSLLRKWEVGSFRAIADAKRGHMSVDGMDDIMSEFPSVLNRVKPLCMHIRGILFPLNAEGRMRFGTPAGDPDGLYKPIIEAYDEAISKL